MTRRACLSIGVGTVEPVPGQEASFAYLDGAVFAARALGQWALHAGFGQANVSVVDDGFVDDSSNPVTEERVRKAVGELFPAGAEDVQLMLLAFCGHGCTDANQNAISWLFTDSLQQKYRVNSARFYGELCLYGVQRITVITDACREAPGSLDLLRLEPRRVLTVHGLPVDSPRIDLMAACQDGQLGYMVLGDGPGARGKCLFSGVIADALWGREESAIERGAITTTSLGICVRNRTAERAREYGLKLHPDCRTDPEPAILHDPAQPFPAFEGLGPWPPVKGKDDKKPMARTVAAGIDPGTLYALSSVSPFDSASPERLMHRLAATVRRLLARRPDEIRSPDYTVPNGTRLFIPDAYALWSERPFVGSGGQFTIDAGAPAARAPAKPVLVEFGDGFFTPICIYAHWFVTTLRSADGSVYQAFGRHGERRDRVNSVDIISEFSNARLGVNRIDELLDGLWVEGEPDPVRGVLCAYLYRTLADYDSIRRLAYLYASRGLAVPFDIALLGAMEVTRLPTLGLQLHIPALKARKVVHAEASAMRDSLYATAALTAPIGGRCPWLGIGWDYVFEAKREWAPLVDGLERLAGRVRRSGFTCLSHDAGLSLAHQLGLPRQAPAGQDLEPDDST